MSDPSHHATFVAPAISQLAPMFPGYEIEILIATGGMGAVYRAIQKSLDRAVAIKILPHEFSKDQAFCEGFEAEAKAMARLNHPNLIGVYDFGEVNGMLYIIMEYVPGKSLYHSSNGIAIDPAEVIRIVTGICNGLAHAHENGILHRDIKPSNILLDLNAEPKIGDFGLARPIERKIQEGEEIFGTPHYTAPEVVNSPHSVDYRADIFSVGVMLHQLLTGKLPADDKRSASAIIRCDPRFDAIIRRATHPQPDLRYASAAEITRELQTIAASAGPRVLKTASPHAPAPPRPGALPVRPLATPKPSSGAGGVIAMIAAAVVIVSLVVMLSKPSEPPPVAGSTAGSGAKISPPLVPPPVKTPDIRPQTRPEPIDDEPEPGPKPHVEIPDDPDPEPVPEPDTTKTDPAEKPTEPDPVTPDGPKFNVPGFLVRARLIMQDRATPLISSRNENLNNNLKEFERKINRLIRRSDWGPKRDAAEEDLEEFVEDCIEADSRIPDKLTKTFNLGDDLKDLHEEYLEKQAALDSALMQSLSQLAGTYILGLEKQIERLKTEDDPLAIALIEEEIKKTNGQENYFPNLMLGIEPEDLKKTGDDGKGKPAEPAKEEKKADKEEKEDIAE